MFRCDRRAAPRYSHRRGSASVPSSRVNSIPNRERRVREGLERGELRDPASGDVDFWLAIYTELILLTEEVLARTPERMVRPRGHLEPIDVGIMEDELTVFRDRRIALTHRREQLMRS